MSTCTTLIVTLDGGNTNAYGLEYCPRGHYIEDVTVLGLRAADAVYLDIDDMYVKTGGSYTTLRDALTVKAAAEYEELRTDHVMGEAEEAYRDNRDSHTRA